MTGPFGFERVLWSRTAWQQQPFPALDRDLEVDCVVVGAGITGLSAALHLAEGGRSVVVLEAEQPGFGASGRNAGGFLSLYLDHSPMTVERALGAERGRRLNEMVASGPRYLRELVAQHQIDADLDGRGVIVAAHNRAAEGKLHDLGRAWVKAGAPVDLLSRDDVRGRTGSGKFGAGILFRDGGTLNPLSYVRGLARAAVDAGATVHGNSPAMGILPQGKNWRVLTAGGHVTAGRVLIATDGYGAMASLWPGLEDTYYRIPVAMLATSPLAMLATSPLAEDQAAAFRAILPVADSNKNNPFWLKLDHGNRLVASLLPPRGDDVSASALARPLMDKMRRLYGALPDLHWEHFWIGDVGVTRERFPRALRLQPGVTAVGGYSGQGLAAATIAGREYAAFILGGDNEAQCRLPFMDPHPVPFRAFVPKAIRSFAAPLSRFTDQSYSHPVA